jgi:hypothetical protein
MNRRSSNLLASKGPVGTEAVALRNMKRNRQDFSYPDCGFVTPIEHSLLYATIGQPKLFPQTVIHDIIADEDFAQYLEVASDNHNDQLAVVASKQPQEQQRQEQHNNNNNPIVSYAQLSAILNLAAESWPSDSDIPKVLCKALLQCVVQYAKEHDLDRDVEVKELMQPLIKLNDRRDGRNAIATILPMYIGLGASMLTLNPACLWAGYAIGNYFNVKAAVQDSERQKKLQVIHTETNRAGDVEQASLLDETEHD